MITVAIVDDHPLIRQGLLAVLEATDDIEVVGTAGDGEEGVLLVSATDPDVVLMDLSMPHVDGLEATRRICASRSRSQVIVLSSTPAYSGAAAAAEAGAGAYVAKAAPAHDLLTAIRAVVGAPGR